MNKASLRSVLSALVVDQEIQVTLRGSPTAGFTVLKTHRGRGKHGSFIALVQRTDGFVTEIGTPKNMEVLNITSNGFCFGVLTEKEEPLVYPTNDMNATALKAGLRDLIGEGGHGKTLTMGSTSPEFHGAFLVQKGRLEKGKYGQVHLWLYRVGETPDPSNVVEFWSYRHSGLIQTFEVTNT